MAVKVIMPQLGLTMTEGRIVRWLKNEGAPVEKGDTIVEIMSDKANFEVEAPASGTLIKILAREGAVVPITQTIAYIGEPGEELPETEKEEPGGKLGTSQEQRVWLEQETIQEKLSGRIFISPRARKTAREKGIPESELNQIQGSGPNGRIMESDMLAWFEETKVKATPLAERIARDRGVDLHQVKGSDTGGKIVSRDVLAHVEGVVREKALGEAKVGPIIPLEGMRKVIAERMSYSAQTKPHVTLTTEVDMTETVNLRRQLNDNGGGYKISFTDLLIKVCAVALLKHPRINAVLEDQQIRIVEQINIGVATALENGLVVPVIKNADQKNLKQISQEAKDKIARTRSGRLSLEEMTGGTFTISNLGMYDIDAFTPIINPPESAILGVGRLVKKPMVYKDEITIRTMMFLSLSFDHRVFDGAPAAEFLKEVKELLEKPYKIILDA